MRREAQEEVVVRIVQEDTNTELAGILRRAVRILLQNSVVVLAERSAEVLDDEQSDLEDRIAFHSSSSASLSAVRLREHFVSRDRRESRLALRRRYRRRPMKSCPLPGSGRILYRYR